MKMPKEGLEPSLPQRDPASETGVSANSTTRARGDYAIRIQTPDKYNTEPFGAMPGGGVGLDGLSRVRRAGA